MMAWFTSKLIKEELIALKSKNNNITIEIVVDQNEVNELYFYDTKQQFKDIGIVIHKKRNKKFLHSKFLVIDETITILGSYNLTKKAKSNSENIAMIYDQDFSQYYIRVFKRLTDENYIDQNIQLLYDFPDFAQKLLASYYPFSAAEFKVFQEKIPLGFCYTFCVGDWDDIDYEPGFIFNAKCALDKRLKGHEFPLPVNKQAIKNWVGSRNDLMILDNYRGHEAFYDEISDELDKNWEGIEKQFKRIIEATYTYKKLKSLIISGIDPIIEDTMWLYNFQMFLDKKLVSEIYETLPKVEKDYWWEEFDEMLKNIQERS